MKKAILFLLLGMISMNLLAVNNCLDFDGTEDYVLLPDNLYTNNLQGGTEITIEYWYKGTTLSSAVRFQEASTNQYVVAGWLNSGTPYFIISTDGETSGLPFNVNIQDGNWHHIACVWKSNTVNGFQVYVDGILTSFRNSANVTLPTVNSGAWIGAYGSNGEYINGKIDEVRIWNDARTETEIRQNMYQELNGNESGLVAYYNFNETSGTTANDGTSSNNDGTLTNMDNADWLVSPAIFGPKNCLEFDGSNDWISTPITMPSTYTKEAWLYIPSVNGNNKNVVSGGDFDGTHALWVPGNTNKLSAGHSLPYDAVQDPNVFPFGSWQHVAVTYSNGTMTLYRNGVQVDQATGMAAFSNGTTVRIGAYNDNQNI